MTNTEFPPHFLLAIEALTLLFLSTGSTTLDRDTLNIDEPFLGFHDSFIPTEATGGNAQFSIHQPSQGMHYIIALQGTFPLKNCRLEEEQSGNDDWEAEGETQSHRFLSSDLLLAEVIFLPGILLRGDGHFVKDN